MTDRFIDPEEVRRPRPNHVAPRERAAEHSRRKDWEGQAPRRMKPEEKTWRAHEIRF